MTRKEIFFFGAIGGILPSLVAIFSIDFVELIDHNSLTLGNYVGYGIRVAGFILAGGIVALINSEVKNPLALVQLGVAAPALLTSYIAVGSGPAAAKAHTAFAIVSVANAAEVSPQDRIRLAQGSFIKDVGAGLGTRLDVVSRANQANQGLGTFCVTSQGKSALPGPAQPVGSACASGGQSGFVTN